MTQMKLSFFQVYHFVHYSTEIYMFSTCKNISKLEPYCVFKTYFQGIILKSNTLNQN